MATSGDFNLAIDTVRAFADQGATEVIYHVTGTDVERELAAFAPAAVALPERASVTSTN
jgi:hypothetical protein